MQPQAHPVPGSDRGRFSKPTLSQLNIKGKPTKNYYDILSSSNGSIRASNTQNSNYGNSTNNNGDRTNTYKYLNRHFNAFIRQNNNYSSNTDINPAMRDNKESSKENKHSYNQRDKHSRRHKDKNENRPGHASATSSKHGHGGTIRPPDHLTTNLRSLIVAAKSTRRK